MQPHWMVRLSVGAVCPVLFSVVSLAHPLPLLAAVPAVETEAQALNQQADRLLQQGAGAFRARQIQAALEAWHSALDLYRQAGNRVGEGRVLGNLGAIYEALGDNQQAIAYFQQSLDAARAINDPEGISFALSNLGYVSENLGDYPQAIAYQREVLDLAQEMGDRESERYALNSLGIIYRAQGDYEQAIPVYQQSLAIARELGQRDGEANALGNLGNVYVDQGDFPSAIAAYHEALPLMQSIGDRVGEAGVLQQLGILAVQLGNPDRGVEYYQQSLAIARDIQDVRLEAYNLGNLASVDYQQGNYDAALAQLQQTLSLIRQTGERPQEAIALNMLGNVASAMGESTTALEYYHQSLAIAREIGNRSSEIIALGSLAQQYDSMDEDEQAFELYQQSIAIARETGNRQNLGIALTSLGTMLFEQDNLEDAADALIEAVQLWEALRPGLSDTDQVSLFETQRNTYRVLQQVLIRLKRYDEALEVSERGRARAFIELVARRLSVPAATQLQTSPPTIDEIRQVAQTQQATLVQYSILANHQLGIWVIQPDGTITFRQSQLEETDLSVDTLAEDSRVAAALGRGGDSDAAITTLVRGVRDEVLETGDRSTNRAVDPLPAPAESTPPRRMNQRLNRLYHLLITPIADLLPTDSSERMVVIPQESLFLVPFAALQADDGQYLIERHTVLTAPAIQVLELTHEQRRQRRTDATTALVVGNPTMPTVGTPPAQLPPLPYAETEAREIGTILNTEAIVGAQATEEAIARQMTSARMIHLATHGLLDEVQGLGVPGAIALAPDATDDGLLTANEILSLSLNADLVVLSACDTGRGRITGDGVIGLSRSFMSAGATSVVVSLWSVPDDATALLMTEFYRNLTHTTDKAQALRQAMLTTMQQYPSSRDWAAFTLMGEAQ